MHNIKSSFIGHKGRCFDLKLSLNSLFLLSCLKIHFLFLSFFLISLSFFLFKLASEDGTSILWDINTKKKIQTLKHNVEAEVLRSTFLSSGLLIFFILLINQFRFIIHCVCLFVCLLLLDTICTAGSDGNAIIWKLNDNNNNSSSSERSSSSNSKLCYSKIYSIPHNDQIYACTTNGFVSTPHIITASENLLHLWDLSNEQNNSYSISFQPYRSNQIDSNHDNSSNNSNNNEGEIGSSFGGPRNPDNKAFIFDVQPAFSTSSTIESNQSYEGNQFSTTLALALSDGEDFFFLFFSLLYFNVFIISY